MNKEIKRLWVEALRSGAYHQGRGYLKAKPDTAERWQYCCLGVLCDLAVKHGVIPQPAIKGAESTHFTAITQFGKPTPNAPPIYTYSTTQLPDSVQHWAGLTRSLPSVMMYKGKYGELQNVGLHILNDDGFAGETYDFAKLADLIEAQY